MLLPLSNRLSPPPAGTSVYLRRPVTARAKVDGRAVHLQADQMGYLVHSDFDCGVLFPTYQAGNVLVEFNWMVVQQYLVSDPYAAFLPRRPDYQTAATLQSAASWGGHKTVVTR